MCLTGSERWVAVARRLARLGDAARVAPQPGRRADGADRPLGRPSPRVGVAVRTVPGRQQPRPAGAGRTRPRPTRLLASAGTHPRLPAAHRQHRGRRPRPHLDAARPHERTSIGRSLVIVALWRPRGADRRIVSLAAPASWFGRSLGCWTRLPVTGGWWCAQGKLGSARRGWRRNSPSLQSNMGQRWCGPDRRIQVARRRMACGGSWLTSWSAARQRPGLNCAGCLSGRRRPTVWNRAHRNDSRCSRCCGRHFAGSPIAPDWLSSSTISSGPTKRRWSCSRMWPGKCGAPAS